eukprot:TRINITY_DN1942_c0_g2_i5.p1 TRINITY_DN1942_c0_g2~~TRINITY_DN1942_c0_g2_i5.p1  ORF type:complete len:359 (-),score=68.75 TRINITY_DN1942_c0_g2_i5:242-1318(-)
MSCAECRSSTATLLRCSRCRSARYCSSQCQRKAWPLHKDECQSIFNSSLTISNSSPMISNSSPTISNSFPTNSNSSPMNSNSSPTISNSSWVSSIAHLIPSPFRSRKGLSVPMHPSVVRDPSLLHNVVFVLHGLGDSPAALHGLMAKMNLPQTLSLCLCGPIPILDFGFAWHPSFDEHGEVLPAQSPSRRRGIDDVTRSLINMINDFDSNTPFKYNRIFLFGFSQGGSVALHVARTMTQRIAGVISVSGPYLDETLDLKLSHKYATPTLISHGLADDMVSISESRKKISQAKEFSADVINYKEYRKGHTLMSSPEEVRDFMDFYAKNMYIESTSMANHPDVIEVTGQKLTVEKIGQFQ